MTEIIFCGTPKPASTVQRRVRSTKAYALVRSIEQSPAQGGITVEGDLEQLKGDSVRSDSLFVRQRADGVCQLLHRELNS